MFKSIQACRGLAALQVVLFHLGAALAAPKYLNSPAYAGAFIFGDSGVEFFFVLSGFIIMWVHGRDLGSPSALPGYLVKRLIRIYPPYWIIFGVVFLVAWMNPLLRSGLPDTWTVLTRSLILLPQDPGKVGGTGAPVLIVAWTLQYEMLFYAAFGLLILHRMFILLIIALYAAAWGSCLGHCGFPAAFFGRDLVCLFGLGGLVAWMSRGRVLLRNPSAMAAVAAGIYAALALAEVMFGTGMYPFSRSLAYGIVFAVLLLGLVQAEQRGVVYGRANALQLLGGASYVLYLLHFPVISVLCKITIRVGLHGAVGAAVAFATILAATLSVGISFHLALERPLLRHLTLLWARVASRMPAIDSIATRTLPHTPVHK